MSTSLSLELITWDRSKKDKSNSAISVSLVDSWMAFSLMTPRMIDSLSVSLSFFILLNSSSVTFLDLDSRDCRVLHLLQKKQDVLVIVSRLTPTQPQWYQTWHSSQATKLSPSLFSQQLQYRCSRDGSSANTTFIANFSLCTSDVSLIGESRLTKH